MAARTPSKDEKSIVRPNATSGDETNGMAELTPSLQACRDFQQAYAFFNDTHWDGLLPPCMVVYTRKKNCLGYFAPDRFQRIDGVETAELALHSGHLATRDDRDSLSTLAHEMAHVWRHYLGPVNQHGQRVTNGYHDRHWANEMLRIGLVPFNINAPDKMTGYRVSHRIQDGGPFDVACQALLRSGFRINWADRIIRSNPQKIDPNVPKEKVAKKDRIKFTCASCDQNAWAKPSANLICGKCRIQMLPKPPTASSNQSTRRCCDA